MKSNELFTFIHKHYKSVIIGLSLLLIASIIILGGNSDKVDASTHNQKYFMCVEIEEGDTLWSIANQYISEEYESVNDYIDEIKSINNLTSDKIYKSATLIVPYYAAP